MVGEEAENMAFWFILKSWRKLPREGCGPHIPGELLVLELNGKLFVFCFLVLTTVYSSCFLLLLFPWASENLHQ